MQAIWSRVGQISSHCRCSSCSLRQHRNIPRGLSSAAYSLGARTFSSGTLLYTGVFTAGYMMDGQQKRSRREKLDATLAKSRAELAQIQQDLQARADRLELSTLPHGEVKDTIVPELSAHHNILSEDEIDISRTPDHLPESRVGYGLGEFRGQRQKLITTFDPILDNREERRRNHGVPGFKAAQPQFIKEVPSTAPLELTPFNALPRKWAAEDRAVDEDISSRRLNDTMDIWPYYQAPMIAEPPSLSWVSWFARPHNSIWAPETMRHRWNDKVWTNKKVYTCELATLKLILRMLLAVGIFGDRGRMLTPEIRRSSIQEYARLSTSAIQEILRQLELDLLFAQTIDTQETDDRKPIARDYGVPAPRYVQCKKPDVAELNRKIASTLEESNRDARVVDADVVVEQICLSLLKSSAPPDTTTQNMLISAFMKFRVHAEPNDPKIWELLNSVVDLGLDVKLRPNEFTCCEILRKYRMERNEQGFDLYLARMMGSHGGLMEAQPNVFIFNDPDYTDHRKIINPDAAKRRVIQVAPSSTVILAEVLRGLVFFKDISRAIEFVEVAKKAGFGLGFEAMEVLLTESSILGDWDSGVWIWNNVEQLANRGYPIPLYIFTKMLVLSQSCDRSEIFEELFWRCLKENERISSSTLTLALKAEMTRIMDRVEERRFKKSSESQLQYVESAQPKTDDSSSVHQGSTMAGEQQASSGRRSTQSQAEQLFG
jgi:hypothetical protein